MRKITNRVLLGLYVGAVVAIATILIILRFQLQALV